MRAALALVTLLAATVAGGGERAMEDIALDGIDVAFLGELHDNPAHHANQAAWVARMQPAALVFEMLTPDLALRVAGDLGDPEALARRLEWESRGWPDFTMYYPIFLAAPDAAVFGGGVPREQARAAVSDGAAATMGDAAIIFGLDQPLPPDEQAAREAGQDAAHCGALPPELLPGMVEAQRLRDAALARAVIAALAETGGPVAVITGNGHARSDRGAPALLDRAMPGLSVISVLQREAPGEDTEPDPWVLTEPHDRGDPCGTFTGDRNGISSRPLTIP